MKLQGVGFYSTPVFSISEGCDGPKTLFSFSKFFRLVTKRHNMEQKKDNTKHAVRSQKTAKVTACV